MVGDDVVVQNFSKLRIADTGLRPVIRVACGIAYQDTDVAKLASGLFHQFFQIRLGRNACRQRNGCARAVGGIDASSDLFAILGRTRRDGHACAVFGESFGDRAADAARRAGDDGDLAV